MLPGIPTLGIRFDIEKVGGGSYGFEAWKIFWGAIEPLWRTTGLGSSFCSAHHADVNAEDKTHRTPLYYTWGGSAADQEIAAMLRSYGGV